MAHFKELDARRARHVRLRKKVSGSAERPRLIRAPHAASHLRHGRGRRQGPYHGRRFDARQIAGRSRSQSKTNVDAAKAVGAAIAAKAKAAGITDVVFDRGGYKYHGRVQALADAAREAGLNF